MNTNQAGKFPDPQNPAARLYGNVLSTHNELHFVEVTHRNSRPLPEPYNAIVPASEFILDSGANKGAWRKQLRGKDGKWIEMGGGIEWTDSNGKQRFGTVTGFDDTNQKVIITGTNDEQVKLDADEIRQSALKAIIPPEINQDLTESDKPEIHPDDYHLFDEDDNTVTPKEFEDFPRGKALVIKDKNNKPMAIIKKTDGDEKDGATMGILINLLMALLPEEVFHMLHAVFRK